MENVQKKIGGNLDFASSEAYNLLRANISFSFPDKTGGKIIGVTSPSPQEGKSLTAVNLSYSLAKSGKKVLLIDGDMRRPTIAKTLGLSASPGLSNLLTGKENKVILTDILTEGLSVIASGDIPPNPSELLGSEKMKNILPIFAEKFDYIIVDLPPVLSVPDAVTISKMIDGFIIIVKHNFTRKSALGETIHQLRVAKARILGFVYNGYYRKKSYYKRGYYKGRYYSGYYYKHNYFYGHDYYSEEKKKQDSDTGGGGASPLN